MKKKNFFLIAAAVVLTVVLSTCRKEYEDIAVEDVLINQPTKTQVEVNDTLHLTATVLPVDAFNPTVKWTSSNAAIATVTLGGSTGDFCIVTAKTPGEVTIIVTTVEGGFTAAFSLTVNQSVSGISLNKTTLSLVEGTSDTLIPTISPSNASNKDITWTSSDNTVASVDSDGKVTALKASTTPIIITATTQDGSKSATCSVTVTTSHIPVTGISLNKTSISLVVGDTETLFASVTPDNATDKAVTWSSSDTSVATVDINNGKVTALKATTTPIIITATTKDGDKKATCSLTVTAVVIPVSTITLDKDTLKFKIGDPPVKLIHTISPLLATDQFVNWSSTDPSIATVDDGNVKLPSTPKTGETTIIATTRDGGHTAFCIVIVEDNYTPVSSVTIDQNTLTLQGSNSGTLNAFVWPDVVTTDKRVIWTSSDSSVVVPDGNGLVGTIEPIPPVVGLTTPRTANIIVTSVDDPTKSIICVVTVNYEPVTGVTINKSTLTLDEGDTETLVATVAPANASIKTVTWSSDDPTVAAVGTKTGIVLATGAGNAEIKATSDADNTKTATCAVDVN